MRSAMGKLRTRWWSGRRGVVVIGLLALGGTMGVVWRMKQQGAAALGQAAGAFAGGMPPMPVDVATARVQPIVDAVRATGRIEAQQAVELRPDEQGRVTDLLFREGQFVAERAPLVQVDQEMLKAQAERARADRDLTQRQLERARRLREQEVTAPVDLERAEVAARIAAATLAMLELQIERTTVRAPFAGVVGQRFVSTGDYVTTATRLLTLQTVDPQRAVIEVPERHAVRLRLGQTLEFTVAAVPQRIFRAQVDFIDPVVQNPMRTILVKARAPNPDRVLRPGMFIEARLATGTRANAVVIPEDAVQPLRTVNVVWAVAAGKASRRVVQLGARAPGVVEIVSGVQAGEQVVIAGLERMAEGMPLAARPRVVLSDSAAAVSPAGRPTP